MQIKFVGPTRISNYVQVYVNGITAGSLEVGEDGYYVWWPILRRAGYIPTEVLRAISDELDRLNSEWDAQVKKDVG